MWWAGGGTQLRNTEAAYGYALAGRIAPASMDFHLLNVQRDIRRLAGRTGNTLFDAPGNDLRQGKGSFSFYA